MKITPSIVLLCALCYSFTKAEFISIATEDGLNIQVSQEEVPFEEALESCSSAESNLLTINTEEKDRKLYTLLLKTAVVLPGTHFWIGASEEREGVWTWTETGQPLLYSRWAIGQPDDTTSLNCGFLASHQSLYWRDANCSAPMFYICEKELMPTTGSNSSSPDPTTGDPNGSNSSSPDPTTGEPNGRNSVHSASTAAILLSLGLVIRFAMQ